MIYARNGYGKSTLCSVLRSVSEGVPSYLLTRKRLGSLRPSIVELKFDGGAQARFDGVSWRSPSPAQVLVFDQEFIHQNLHVGDSVTRDNKRSLLPLVLGSRGVELSQNIIDLDREQRELDSSLKAAARSIRGAHPVLAGENLEKFAETPVPYDIEGRIVLASQKRELARNARDVVRRREPRLLTFRRFDEIEELLGRGLSEITADVAQLVRDHIATHDLGERAVPWLKYGAEHALNDDCPFCGQSTKGLTLVDAYGVYFSKAFAELSTACDAFVIELESLIGEASTLDALESENNTDLAFWKTVCELGDLPQLTFADLESIKQAAKDLLGLVRTKLANPSTGLALGGYAMGIRTACEAVAIYNERINEVLPIIKAAKAASATADLDTAERNLNKWLALRAKSTSTTLAEDCTTYLAAARRAPEVAGQKAAAQNELKEFAKTTVGSRQAEINTLLANFGVNFEVVDTRANFVGRDPNTDFALSIGGHKIAAGEVSDTAPSFKTVLSTADKNTLALAFFISVVNSVPNIQDTIVVFDDPFNSQDVFRRFETGSQIRSIAKKARQVIVMSHDAEFLHLIEKDTPDTIATGSFQLTCDDDGAGTIAVWSAAEELKALYVRQMEQLREFANRGTLLKDVTLMGLVQAMRPFCEDYLRARYPGRFGDKQMLASMTDDIENAGPADAMHAMVGDLRAINEYTRPEHHGGGQIPEKTELRAQAQRIIRMIGSY